jgi:hypothetical protein
MQENIQIIILDTKRPYARERQPSTRAAQINHDGSHG